MKCCYSLETIFDFIAEADDAGVMKFSYPAYMTDLLEGTKAERLRGIMEDCFQNVQYVGVHLRRGKTWIEKFQASAEKQVDGSYACSVNLAMILGLPGLHPKAELQELTSFLSGCKEFIASMPPDKSSDVLVTNEREGSGKVYGQLLCRRSTEGSRMEIVTESTARLRKVAASSPVLTAWLRSIGLTLGRVGRYSWWSLTERQLFPPDEQPRSRHLMSMAAAKYAAQKH